MKILIATNMIPTPSRPYLGIFVREQAEALRDAGVEVEIAAHVADGNRLLAYGRGLWELTRALRRGDYALIHTHHTYSTILALAARRLARRPIPIVFTFHESEIFARGPGYGQDRLRRLKYVRWIKGWALARADFVIPVQRDMVTLVLGEARAARVPQAVIPAGINMERFRPMPKAEARAALGWEPDGIYIFFPCDPAKPEKRHDLARGGFEHYAAMLAPEARERLHLVVGGQVDYDRMPLVLAASDVVLHPTDYEASPTVVKEALACEVPVVSTDVGDVREAYTDVPGVILCEPTAQDVAWGLREALAVPTPYGGRVRLARRGLSRGQVALNLKEVYAWVLDRPSG